MTAKHGRGDPYDLNLLPVLLALLEYRSVTRAAQELGLTQSGASRALARLRALFRDPLLVREGAGMAPTARAEALLPTLQRLIQESSRLIDSGGDFEPASARGTIRLRSADFAVHVFLPPFLREVSGRAPGLDLAVLPPARGVDSLLSGEVDFVIDVAGMLDHPDLARTPLLEEGFCCLLRTDHPYASGRLTKKRYAELDHVLVAPGGKSGGVVDRVLEREGLGRRVSVQVPSFLVVPRLLLDSDRIATLPSRLAADLAAHWPLVARRPPVEVPSFRIQLFWMERRRTDPIHRWLRRVAAAVAAEL